jgi:ABC-type branched-subunit amino acid transport system substrate-binding protein
MIVPTRTTGLGLLLAAGVGAALGACSLAVNFEECRNDDDCLLSGGGQWQCVQGKCVDPGPGDDSTTGATVTPTTTATSDDPSSSSADPSTGPVSPTTTDASSSTTSDDTGSSSDTGVVSCELNTECEATLGDGFLCIEGTCITALSAECQQLIWPSQGSHDKVVLMGSIIPASPPFDAITVPLQNAVQLAIEDYNRTTDLPGGRRIAWLACDDAGNADKALAAAEHLTGTLKVPAIVGPVFSEQVIDVATKVTIPAGTFLITPSASSKQITTLDDDNLVWRPIASDVYQANALADRTLELAPSKAAMLGKADAYGKGIISDVTKVVNPVLGAKFKSYEYPDPVSMTPQEIMAAYAQILANMWGPKGAHPDHVLIAGTSEAINLVGGTLIAWGSENPPPKFPRFIVTHGAVPSMEDIVNAVSDDAVKMLLMPNVEGVAPDVLDPQNFAAFNIRYKIRFNDSDAITASSLGYDAAMVTIFAMSAIPQGEPVTGAAIAANMAKLVDAGGAKVSFDDVDGTELVFIKKAHNALVSAKTVDLKGVSGELSFDLATGEVRTNVIGWGLTPKMGMPTVPVLTPLRVYVLDPPPKTTGTWMDL